MNDIYEQKAKKYKYKYLELKKEIEYIGEGGAKWYNPWGVKKPRIFKSKEEKKKTAEKAEQKGHDKHEKYKEEQKEKLEKIKNCDWRIENGKAIKKFQAFIELKKKLYNFSRVSCSNNKSTEEKFKKYKLSTN